MGGQKRKAEQIKNKDKKAMKKTTNFVGKKFEQPKMGKKQNKMEKKKEKVAKKAKVEEVEEEEEDEEIESESDADVEDDQVDEVDVDEEDDDDEAEDDEDENDDGFLEVEDDEEEEELPKQPKKVKKASQPPPMAKDDDDSVHGESQPPSTRVFVSNLARSSTNESLSKFFEANHLKLKDVFLPKGGQGAKGYAFVELESIDMAHKAIAMTGQALDGSNVNICFAKPRRSFQAADSSESQETNILFIKGLSSSTTKENLQKHFAEASDIRVMCNPDGSCKGHAFVEFTTSECAKSKKDSLTGSNIDGSRVVVDFAAPRGANRFTRGGFRGSRGSQDFKRDGGHERGGFFKGRRGGAGKSFERGNRFGGRPRGGGFRGGHNNRGSRGLSRGTHIQFDND